MGQKIQDYWGCGCPIRPGACCATLGRYPFRATGFSQQRGDIWSYYEGVELVARITAIYAEVEIACLKGVSRLKTQLANALVKMYAGVLEFLSRASRYFAQSSGKRALKGAFQSYQTTVAPWIERIKNAETDTCKLVDLVQSEGSSCEAINRDYGTLTISRSEKSPEQGETRSAGYPRE